MNKLKKTRIQTFCLIIALLWFIINGFGDMKTIKHFLYSKVSILDLKMLILPATEESLVPMSVLSLGATYKQVLHFNPKVSL